MTAYVLDAGVAAKCVLPPEKESLAFEAVRLLGAYAGGELSLIVPDLFWAELGNVLWNGVRRQRLTKSAAEEGLALMQARSFPTLPSAPLLSSAFAMAVAFNCTVYDCLYVALASQIGVEFLTADEGLANSLSGQLPVRWLGAL